MQIGMIGLGRMGANMARRLDGAGIKVRGFSLEAVSNPNLGKELGLDVTGNLDGLVAGLAAPRIVWVMVPSGPPTEENVQALSRLLAPGDIVVDGGNSYYRDSQRRAAFLAQKDIGFVDAGVSGGIWGLENGYGVMVGGDERYVEPIMPLIRALAPAPDKGWVYCGPSGAGHFTKMVHNGIEYGLMQAYAEGMSILAAKKDLHLPLAAIAEAWCHGTVIRSWLLELTRDALRDEAALDSVLPKVADSGEGRWTAHEAIDLGVPAPVISTALMARFASQGSDDFGARLLALLRRGFGGHAVSTAPAPPPHR
jgi:6-phosphogluconate dehydrogenase